MDSASRVPEECGTDAYHSPGAGAAGSSSAYYLRKYLEDSGVSELPVEIVVFEKNSYVGGRSTTVNAWDDPSVPLELGASIFVGANYNLVNASSELNLTVTELEETAKIAKKDNVDVLGIFDGEKMLFQYPEGKWWGLAKLILRYGPFAPYKAKKLTESTVGKFLNMYEAPVFPFKSLTQAVEDVGLLEAAGSTGDQYLKANGIEGGFADELIQASTRVNYGQNLGLIHGVETMVCLAAEGAMAIEGGNWQIFARMLNASSTNTRISTTVTSLTKNVDNEWVVSWSPEGSRQLTSEIFDEVIIAAPYQQTGVSVQPALEKTPDVIPYVTLHVTLFASPRRLDPTLFGLPASANTPAVILTTLNAAERLNDTVRQGTGVVAAGSAGFFSVSTLRTSERESGTEYVYKVFSPEELGDEKIMGIVGATDEKDITWKYRKEWLSYPYEYPRVTFEETQIADNLWYTAGMESFISTMETSSLMGKNIARLIVNSWEDEKAKQVADAAETEGSTAADVEPEVETVAAKEPEPETAQVEPEAAEVEAEAVTESTEPKILAESSPEEPKLETPEQVEEAPEEETSTPEPAEEAPVPPQETPETPEPDVEAPLTPQAESVTPEAEVEQEMTAEDPTAIEPETETRGEL